MFRDGFELLHRPAYYQYRPPVDNRPLYKAARTAWSLATSAQFFMTKALSPSFKINLQFNLDRAVRVRVKSESGSEVVFRNYLDASVPT
jgi:hypothetical protein